MTYLELPAETFANRRRVRAAKRQLSALKAENAKLKKLYKKNDTNAFFDVYSIVEKTLAENVLVFAALQPEHEHIDPVLFIDVYFCQRRRLAHYHSLVNTLANLNMQPPMGLDQHGMNGWYSFLSIKAA